ncbi:hypothetical protein GIB67_037392 [Kingdonia uniflora]|uniref:Retrotransposon Copia-like N-terminal domain-containing protein n=1 Tax=Kingdonia uniflora TaxID=39325 RepID=A0A7J7M8S5_9MAGN|nr:hypothetical protein GIB67_037392 [Kingdonia uniflora]
MAIGDESSSSSIVSSIGTSEDVQSFNSVHDNPNLKITSQLLDGLNYARWAQSVKLFIGSRDRSTISARYLFTNNAHLIWESLPKVYSQQENNARIFQLSNEIRNFKQSTQTLGMYYARLRSSWEKLSHYDSFVEWPASAPSEKIPIPPTAAKIYAKIVEKTRAHAYCLSGQSCRSPIPPISGIPSETSAMAIRYAYPAPPSVPSQASHTSSPSLSLLPTASGNSRPSRKKCDYCVCQILRPLVLSLKMKSTGSDNFFLFLPHRKLLKHVTSHLVYTRRHPRCQPLTLDCQTSSVAPDLPPAIDSPLSGQLLVKRGSRSSEPADLDHDGGSGCN